MLCSRRVVLCTYARMLRVVDTVRGSRVMEVVLRLTLRHYAV